MMEFFEYWSRTCHYTTGSAFGEELLQQVHKTMLILTTYQNRNRQAHTQVPLVLKHKKQDEKNLNLKNIVYARFSGFREQLTLYSCGKFRISDKLHFFRGGIWASYAKYPHILFPHSLISCFKEEGLLKIQVNYISYVDSCSKRWWWKGLKAACLLNSKFNVL